MNARSTALRAPLLTALMLAAVLLLAACGPYGGDKIDTSVDGGRIETELNYCAVNLPDGWVWMPAKWAARSPNGTEMSFLDWQYGRPQYPEWSEARDRTLKDVAARTPNAVVEATDDRILVDYGANGGMMLLQRFDRIGCQITFAHVGPNRDAELPQWRAIMASLQRSSPTPGFTPPSD